MHLFQESLTVSDQPLDSFYSKNFYSWKNCADDNLIKSIIDLGESLKQVEAKIGIENRILHEKRVSSLSWVKYNEESKFFFDFLINKIEKINYYNYGMNLTAIGNIQYTRYPVGGHYGFHNDMLIKNKLMRKLTAVLSLTNESDYVGGEFLIMPHGENPTKIRFSKGELIVFPSWVPHKVQPVISGLRITAVAWIFGPLLI